MEHISTPHNRPYDLYRNEYYPGQTAPPAMQVRQNIPPVMPVQQTAPPVMPVQQDSPPAKARPGKLRRHLWAWCYGTALTAYTIFTLLNVFVIPHDTVKMDRSAMAEVYQTDPGTSGAASGTSSDASSGKGDTITTMDGIGSSSADGGSASAGGSSADSGSASADGSSADSGSASAGGSSAYNSTSGTVTATETGYQYKDDSMTITLTQSYVNDTMVYIADIQLSSIATLKSGLAEDSFGRNVKEKTSEIADRVGAILAINGDYYGFRDTGYVIRNGILYRDTMSSQTAQDLVIYEDGSMKIIREGDVTAEELLDEGALQVYSFGPGLIVDGEITVTADAEVAQSMNSNPRTAIGYISPLHYVMVVSDGRTSESAGLSLLQLAEIMDQLGCEQAYNLDGGGSTTMYFNGEVINNPTSNGKRSKERSVSDIVYIGY